MPTSQFVIIRPAILTSAYPTVTEGYPSEFGCLRRTTDIDQRHTQPYGTQYSTSTILWKTAGTAVPVRSHKSPTRMPVD